MTMKRQGRPDRAPVSSGAIRSDFRLVLCGLAGFAVAGILAGAGLAVLGKDQAKPDRAVLPLAAGPTAGDPPPGDRLPLPRVEERASIAAPPAVEAPPAAMAATRSARKGVEPALPADQAVIEIAAGGPSDIATVRPVSDGPAPPAQSSGRDLVSADIPVSVEEATPRRPPPRARPVQAAARLEVPRPRRVRDGWLSERLDPGMGIPHRLTTMFVPQELSGMDRTWRTVEDLHDIFGRVGYDLQEVRARQAGVPRVFVASFPDDIEAIELVEDRKRTFIKTVLPLILRANEQVLAERSRLEAVIAHLEKGGSLARSHLVWLEELADRYGGSAENLSDLLRRVDVVPISLALAQAAEESGWGTSRFARQGNAIFGQWTWDTEAGIVPRNRPRGRNHLVRKFPVLQHSVSAYVRNLNSNPAYAKFRAERARMRSANAALSGRALAAHLTAYSERGAAYVGTLRSIMAQNGLEEFDDVQMANHDGRWTAGLPEATLLSVF